MSQKIIQVVGRLTISADEFDRQNGVEGARFFAQVPGLLWKIWLINRETGEAGGIKLFADEATFDAYFNGPIMEQVRNAPMWTDVSVKVFDYLPAQSAITRAPVGESLDAWTHTEGSFAGLAEAAHRAVPSLSPADAWSRIRSEPGLLVLDMRDAADVAATGTIPGALNISYGALTYQADRGVPEAWRAPQLADRSRPIITTCILGPLGALGGKLLHDYGFTNVSVLEGGVQAWINAGYPVSRNGADHGSD